MQIEDQASRLRRLMHDARETRTIAVASGKGGVGKSNVALNLSILLSVSGKRVALVDGDLGLANLDVLVGVNVRANLSHVIAGKKRLKDVIIDLPCGVQFIPGASGLVKMASLSEFERARLIEELTALEADNDVIVIDCGAGISSEVLRLSTAAEQVLAVTTPEPTAITDTYALIKVLTQRGYRGQISLLVNFASSRHEARVTCERVSEVARQFLGRQVFDGGHVLDDPTVSEAVCRREPLVLAYPKCPASRCIAALATRLSAGGRLVQPKHSFFQHVANWLSG